MTDQRIGSGFDVHAFVTVPAGRNLRLAGVTIPDGPALDGHSDADVAVHAVIDALLGALALGDMGQRFGVDDPAIAGADSLRLLGEVVDDVTGRGWQLANVDLTIIAQRPRLAAHREAMRANLAATLDTSIDAVSVKMTTTDRLGSIGRGQGIAAWATCLLEAAHR